MTTGVRITGFAAALVGTLVLTAVLQDPGPASTDKGDLAPSAATPPRELEARLPSGRSAPPTNQSQPALVAAPNPRLPLPADARAASTPVVFSMPQVAEDVQIASPEVAGQIAEAEREMALQGSDSLRSPAMEARIFSEIAQKALGLEITYLQADCRITLCRLQFTLPKSFLEKKFGDVPHDAVWTGREPVGFFIKALDLEWRYTAAFGGVDRYGAPVVLGYVAMPLPSPEL